MSDKSKMIKTSIGGQALNEGIMMRGPVKTAIAVRDPDGKIQLEVSENGTRFSKLKKIPVLRGVFSFADSLITGYKALMRSVEIAFPEESAAGKEASESDSVDDTDAGDQSGTAETPAATEVLSQDSDSADTSEDTSDTVLPADPVIAGSLSPQSDTSVGPDSDGTISDADKAPAGDGVSTGPDDNDIGTDTEVAPESGPAGSAKAGETQAVKDAKDRVSEGKGGSGSFTAAMIIGVVLGLALAIFLFKFLPELIYGGITALFPSLSGSGYGYSLLRAFITGVLKIVILVGYMAAISQLKEIKRTFMYHGAEHKTIFCYEKGLELTTENIRLQRRFHPRCGTSFLILSVLVSIFFGMFIPNNLVQTNEFLNVLARTGIGLLMLPLIIGFGYELIRIAGRHDNLFTRIISAPGVWLQHITTKEPDDGMIECAVAAVKEVIPGDGSDII